MIYISFPRLTHMMHFGRSRVGPAESSLSSQRTENNMRSRSRWAVPSSTSQPRTTLLEDLTKTLVPSFIPYSHTKVSQYTKHIYLKKMSCHNYNHSWTLLTSLTPFSIRFYTLHNTETALLKGTNLLLSADILVLLDLSAALNTVDHDILMTYLQQWVGIKV